MEIQAVIFDLGGVYFSDGKEAFVLALCKRHRLARARVEGLVDGKIGSDYRVGRISAAAFWERMRKDFALRESKEELQQLWFGLYQPFSGTIDLVRRLRKRCKVAYLSDNAPDRTAFLEGKYHYQHEFDLGVYSHEAGVRKPNPRIYRLVLGKLGLPATSCVFIDDRKVNLPPAKRMGMKTILFESASQVEREVRKLGVDLEPG